MQRRLNALACMRTRIAQNPETERIQNLMCRTTRWRVRKSHSSFADHTVAEVGVQTCGEGFCGFPTSKTRIKWSTYDHPRIGKEE